MKDKIIELINEKIDGLIEEWKRITWKNSCGACAIQGAIDEFRYLKDDILELEPSCSCGCHDEKNEPIPFHSCCDCKPEE